MEKTIYSYFVVPKYVVYLKQNNLFVLTFAARAPVLCQGLGEQGWSNGLWEPNPRFYSQMCFIMDGFNYVSLCQCPH